MFDGDSFRRALASLMLAGEDTQPNLSERRSPHVRRLQREGLDADLCVQAHELGRAQMEQVNAEAYTLITSFGEEPQFSSARLSSLEVTTLPELLLCNRHYGKFLRGHLCVKPFRMSAIHSVLKDDTGSAVRLSIYNALPATASKREVEARFPLGMRVIIKEPFFKLCVDGKTAIRVDNPADIALDETWNTASLPPHLSAASVIDELELIRCEGNKLFGEQDWHGAASTYSRCIDEANSRMTTSDAFNRLLLLAYSNRAEARLRLGAYEDALTDADKGIELDPKHVKTLVRKGRAAHGLGLYEKSSQVFEAALELAPNEESVLNILRASRSAYEQSQTGDYDLSNFYSRDGSGVIPPLADFVGPVEIRRVPGGHGEQGLFAIKEAKQGQLLVVSNPLAIVRQKSQLKQVSLHVRVQSRGTQRGVLQTGCQRDLIVELADRVMKSKRKMAQLYCLASYNKGDMAIPSMELFRPGSEWVPPGAEKLEINVRLISEIAQLNSFGSDDKIFTQAHNLRCKDDSSGRRFFRALGTAIVCEPLLCAELRTCLPGKQPVHPLICPYCGGRGVNHLVLAKPLRRSFTSKSWAFTCKCSRCTLEETLQPQLPRVSRAILKPESLTEAQKRRAIEKLARVADKVETVIQGNESGLGPKLQGWIRASFISAYLAKFKLAADHSECRVTSLRLVVDSMSCVSVTLEVLRLAGNLLRETEQSCFKHSPSYRSEHDRVLGICNIIFGKLPNSIQQKLIRGHWAPLGPEVGKFRVVEKNLSACSFYLCTRPRVFLPKCQCY